MKTDCHIHIFMDGENFKKARDRHKSGVDETVIRKHLTAYRDRNITYLRDGGDGLGVSVRAKEIAREYGITYRTPVFAIHKKGCYGNIVGRSFSDLAEYARLVQTVRKQGGDFIKIMTTGILDFDREGVVTGERLPFSEVCQMVHIAHEEGFAVMAHVNGADAVREAVLAGVDSIEHGNYQDRDSLQALADSHAVWVPTLVTVQNLQGKGRFDRQSVEAIGNMQKKTVRMAFQLGVSMAVGTDAGAWMVPHGASVLQEWEVFHRILGRENRVDQTLQRGNAIIRERF